jgi:hypothetical protein
MKSCNGVYLWNVLGKLLVFGHTMLIRLGVHRRKLFEEYKKSGWDYKLTDIQHIYPLYRLGDITLYRK